MGKVYRILTGSRITSLVNHDREFQRKRVPWKMQGHVALSSYNNTLRASVPHVLTKLQME